MMPFFCPRFAAPLRPTLRPVLRPTPPLARLLAALLLVCCQAALAADERFEITAFHVEGNSLLSKDAIGRALNPSTGAGKAYGDIQQALEALERSYRQAGYTAVNVHLPEQELTGGIVRIEVTESTIGAVTISGNRHFDDANIRASLRPLQVGKPPRLSELSDALALANDNPAKHVAVTLASGAQDAKVDAQVSVTDQRPLRVVVSVDHTGTDATGKWRTGVALQHANLFNRDQVASVAYTTSPDSPAGVHVRLWSVGYRIPLYALGDSIDVIYGNSSVNTPGASPTLGTLLGIVGKGDVLGLRWNHHFARQGSATSKLVLSIDRKYSNARCSINGVEVSIDGPTPAISSCIPYTTMPLALSYARRWQEGAELFDVNLAVVRNLPLGARYTNVSGESDRYSYLTPGNRSTRDSFMLARAGATYFKAYAGDWQVRLAATAQLARDALLASEQFGLAGSGSVRGFNERAVAADGGVVLNAELITPDLAGKTGLPGTLRLLTFYDVGRGNNLATGATAVPAHVGVASAGVGLRYAASRDVDVRADLGRVIDAGPSMERRGAWKGHVAMILGF